LATALDLGLRLGRFDIVTIEKGRTGTMRIAVLIVAAGMLGVALAGPADAALRCQNTGNFDTWVAQFKKDAIAQGISPKVVAAAAPDLTFEESVIKRDSGQAVFQRTFLDFANRLIGGARIPNGKAKMQQHAALFARIEKVYGVPAPVLTAAWGLESDYGALFGKFKILPSLTTLAYDCRRGDHFRPELMDALRIIQRGDKRVDEMTGNWAGEFGGMQFTPSNYIKYGVDFDGDGRRDLTNSIPDTLASAANYLKSIGWKRGEPWLQEVRVPDNMPWQEADLEIQHPRAQWIKWGVQAAHGSLPRDNKPAALILPMGRLGPAFLAYENFKVFIDWNSSYVYSTTVAYFATRLDGAPPVNEAGAKRVKQLTTEQMMDLQRELDKRGHDVGEVDGRLGAGTRKAVKAMQLKYGLPADSWPTTELIARVHNDTIASPPPSAKQTPSPARANASAPQPERHKVSPPLVRHPTPVAKRTPPPVKQVTVKVLTVRGCLTLTMPINRLQEYRRC
jgi:lytic murein transglycosylase